MVNERSVAPQKLGKSEADIVFTRKYLDATSGKGCYEETYLESPEERLATKEKLKPLKYFLSSPREVVSVGVGSGAEVLALIELFGSQETKITGLDLSVKTLETVRERLGRLQLTANLITGSAIDMPFPKDSIDTFVESSLLHEIYSYVSRGRAAWKRDITEVAEKLSENGIFLLRDFSAPHETYIKLTFKTDFSKRFYEYFSKQYRTFEGWDEANLEGIEDRRGTDDEDYPKLSPTTSSILISMPKAAEFMLHFRYFYENYMAGTTNFDDVNWKEVNETYLVPNPNRDDTTPMPREEYVQMVLDVANGALKDTSYKFICIQNMVSQRLETAAFLREHFSIRTSGKENDAEEQFLQITEKMELVFRKVKK